MAKISIYMWLAALVVLLIFFVVQYNELSTRSKVVLGIAMFVSAMMYGFRSSKRRK